MRFKSSLLAAVCVAAPFVCSALDIDSAKFENVLSESNLFDIEASSFIDEKSRRNLFNWLNSKQDEAHFQSYKSEKAPKLLFFGAPVQESIIRFKDGKLSNIYISLYNRGDAGNTDIDSFNKMVADVDSKLSSLSGVKGVDLKKSQLTANTNTLAKAWVKEPLAIVLKWNYSNGKTKKEDKPEYIQITVEKFNPQDDPRKRTSVGDLRANMSETKELPQNLKKNDTGDVHIENIPMVDQGGKGYCVDATVARVLRYYGVEVTQHDIAQIADADANKGTSLKAMIAGMRKISKRYGVKTREYYKNELEMIDDARDVDKYVKKYNDAAKKMKRATIKTIVRDKWIMVGETIDQMEKDVLARSRLDDKMGQKNFLRDIKASVDKGVPLIWAVDLSLAKEKDIPQLGGPHMRLITGYNEKEGQIIYSDSWGSEHDVKKQSNDDAWVKSNVLMSLEPLK